MYQVEVIGYTDTLGTPAYNQQLSLKRAVAIRDRLARDGLSAASISVAGAANWILPCRLLRRYLNLAIAGLRLYGD